VGAALRSMDGRVYGGCNVENAAYPMCICAERVALVKAVSEGVRTFDVIAVATRDGGTPCGMCRQMLSEFAPQLRVLIVDEGGALKMETTLDKLLPGAFTPASLQS
jgi:cytidine deaminase